LACKEIRAGSFLFPLCGWLLTCEVGETRIEVQVSCLKNLSEVASVQLYGYCYDSHVCVG